MSSLGATADTMDYAVSYSTCVIVFGVMPTVMANVMSTLIRSVGESKKAGFGKTMGGIINIFLDPLFMFVLFPGGKEAVGAGTATCISNIITCVYFILQLNKLSKDGILKLCALSEFPAAESIRSMFSVGIPSSLTTLLFDVDYMVLDKLMSAYGSIPLAAVGIVLKAERLPLNVGIGICQGYGTDHCV